MNNLNQSKSDTREFLERPFEEVEGGYYDGKGFYCTPEGSFWDENGVYFNREGLDKHGGFYDEYCNYNPGPGWLEEFACYEDEMNLDIDDNIKEVINKNIYEELVEGYHYYQNLYKNYDNDDINDLDEDFINKNDEEIFEEYIQKHFSNVQGLDNKNGNSSSNNNQSYDNPNIKTSNLQNNLENSIGKNNLGLSNERVKRFDSKNSEHHN